MAENWLDTFSNDSSTTDNQRERNDAKRRSSWAGVNPLDVNTREKFDRSAKGTYALEGGTTDGRPRSTQGTWTKSMSFNDRDGMLITFQDGARFRYPDVTRREYFWAMAGAPTRSQTPINPVSVGAWLWRNGYGKGGGGNFHRE